MKGINVFDIMIHNKVGELRGVSADYMWHRRIANSFEERDAALHKANLKFFNIKQEINQLQDLRDRLEAPEYFEDEY